MATFGVVLVVVVAVVFVVFVGKVVAGGVAVVVVIGSEVGSILWVVMVGAGSSAGGIGRPLTAARS